MDMKMPSPSPTPIVPDDDEAYKTPIPPFPRQDGGSPSQFRFVMGVRLWH